MDWLYTIIRSNQPFVRARNKLKKQTADMEAVFGADWKGLGMNCL